MGTLVFDQIVYNKLRVKESLKRFCNVFVLKMVIYEILDCKNYSVFLNFFLNTNRDIYKSLLSNFDSESKVFAH